MAERDLARLLEGLSPRLDPRRVVFVAAADAAERARIVASAPLMAFEEPEGLAAILEAERAIAAGLAPPSAPQFAWIVLHVLSDLEAVGLTAAVAAALAEIDIPANVVAATRHDHVFVPAPRAAEALARLERLSAEARAEAAAIRPGTSPDISG